MGPIVCNMNATVADNLAIALPANGFAHFADGFAHFAEGFAQLAKGFAQLAEGSAHGDILDV